MFKKEDKFSWNRTFSKHHRIENGKGRIGIPAFVGKEDLFNNAGFPQVVFGLVTVRTENVHSDLGAGISAEYGAVLHDSGFDTHSRRGDSGAHTGKSAADYYHIKIRVFSVYGHNETSRFLLGGKTVNIICAIIGDY